VPVTPPESEPPPHYLGHRDRLRGRFLTNGPDSLQDYELLELLLFPAIPRRDVKPLAKQLLESFGSFWAVINAPPEALRVRFKLSDAATVAIIAVGAAARRMARQQILDRPLLSNWQAVLDYCQGTMALEPVEQFRVLFLNKRYHLVAEEVLHRGTVDHTSVYPREVIKRALEHGASALVLVHNHPTGDPTPSRDDVAMTGRLLKAAAAVGIRIHDHLVIGRFGHVSFKDQGLLREDGEIG